MAVVPSVMKRPRMELVSVAQSQQLVASVSAIFYSNKHVIYL